MEAFSLTVLHSEQWLGMSAFPHRHSVSYFFLFDISDRRRCGACTPVCAEPFIGFAVLHLSICNGSEQLYCTSKGVFSFAQLPKGTKISVRKTAFSDGCGQSAKKQRSASISENRGNLRGSLSRLVKKGLSKLANGNESSPPCASLSSFNSGNGFFAVKIVPPHPYTLSTIENSRGISTLSSSPKVFLLRDFGR